MSSADDLLSKINNSNLASTMGNLQKAVILSAMQMLLPTEGDLDKDEIRRNEDARILNSVGPAAASAAVEHAINVCRAKGHFQNVQLNDSYINNYKMVRNEPGDPDFTSVLRQFLLPRYAYLDFDIVVDPRHKVDLECGYPKFITPIMYRYMYDRDDVARRVVDCYPNESWTVDPVVYEEYVDREPTTTFEKAWADLCDSHNILQNLYRIDRLSGIGHYGALLLGIDDGQDLETPISEERLLQGHRRTVGTKQRGLLYLRPFDEYLSFIHQYETNVTSPRYGLPKFYNLIFLDMTIDAAGASIGTRLNRRVHWSRVVHVADNLMSSLVFGIPRQQSVFNRELDLRKIKGASGEMFWKGGFPGISFEVDPKFVADNPEFDVEGMREQVQRYWDGLDRGLFFQGITAKSLQPEICDNPEKFVDLHLKAICTQLEIPMPIFIGHEEGKLASVNNMQIWNKRLKRRNRLHVAPNVIRSFIDRLIAIGCLPPPESGSYKIDFPGIDEPTNEDLANLSLKWTQALSQYVATGMIHLIQPIDYLTIIMGLTPANANRIMDAVDNAGGLAKLKAVDPAQGAGVNGTRTNIADSGNATDKPRNSSDKSTEGMTTK